MAREKESGSSLGQLRAYQAELEKVGVALLQLDTAVRRYRKEGNELRDIRLKAPPEEEGEWFVIVRAVVQGDPFVGFHSAYSAGDALRGAVNRVLNGTMKWKADDYGSK